MSGGVLVTGFDAFGRLGSNPSAELVNALAEQADARFETAILPTSYRGSELALEALLAEHRPNALLMFGYAQLEGFRLERWARNRDNPASIDNEGIAGGAVVVSGGSRFVRARGRLRPLRRRLQRAGIRAEISRNAGGYVCNHAYYYALNAARRSGRPKLCLFVHVGDWKSSARPDDAVHGARLLLDACLSVARGPDSQRS